MFAFISSPEFDSKPINYLIVTRADTTTETELWK